MRIITELISCMVSNTRVSLPSLHPHLLLPKFSFFFLFFRRLPFHPWKTHPNYTLLSLSPISRTTSLLFLRRKQIIIRLVPNYSSFMHVLNVSFPTSCRLERRRLLPRTMRKNCGPPWMSRCCNGYMQPSPPTCYIPLLKKISRQRRHEIASVIFFKTTKTLVWFLSITTLMSRCRNFQT